MFRDAQVKIIAARQTSFASLEYEGKKRKTRREKFLEEMGRVVPRAALIGLIEPHYPRRCHASGFGPRAQGARLGLTGDDD